MSRSTGYRRILYRSIPAEADFHRSDIAILRSAIRNNARVGITGYLWRANGQFFQALHGPAAALEVLIAKIKSDPRHAEMEILLDTEADPQTPFAEWSMGYDHFLAMELGVDLEEGDERPSLSRAQAEEIYAHIASAAETARLFGSGFPYARRSGETTESYLERLAEIG